MVVDADTAPFSLMETEVSYSNCDWPDDDDIEDEDGFTLL